MGGSAAADNRRFYRLPILGGNFGASIFAQKMSDVNICADHLAVRAFLEGEVDRVVVVRPGRQ